jgi:vancomycin resistance protein YoaR
MIISKTKKTALIFAIPLLAFIIFEMFYWNRPYPNVLLGQNRITSKTDLITTLQKRQNQILTFQISNSEIKAITLNSNLVQYDSELTWQNLIAYGRNGNFFQNLLTKFRLIFQTTSLEPVYDFDDLTFDTLLADMLRPYEKEPLNSQIIYENGRVISTFARAGRKANRAPILQEVRKNLILQTTKTSFQLNIEPTLPQITPENSHTALLQTQIALSRPLTILSTDGTYRKTLDSNQIFTLLQYNYNSETQQLDVNVANYKLALLLSDIPSQLNQEPTPGKSEQIGNILILTEQPQPGRKVDTEKLTQLVTESLFSNQSSAIVEIPIQEIKPALTTATVNQYGIKDVLGEGVSYFQGSSPARLQNIRIASQKLNGALIPPNTTFSMYQQVGDIEKRTGFTDSIIIKNGRTIPGVGGGVCQVSTTLYRAALWSGLPIIERRPHRFRVSYYEQNSPPGLDAAIYFPYQDLKFYNDTNKHIVIQSLLEENISKLTIKFWGVHDGRKVTLSEPTITDRRPPPPELRINSADIPQGTIRQTDFAVEGARIEITRTIQNTSQSRSEIITSIYRPWQAVYLIGTGTN